MSDVDQLGKRLHEARIAAGMSTRQLEVAAGVSSGTVSRLERGQRKQVAMMVLRKLAKVLGRDVDDLVSEAPTKGEHAPETVREPPRYFRELAYRSGWLALTASQVWLRAQAEGASEDALHAYGQALDAINRMPLVSAPHRQPQATLIRAKR